MDSVRIAALAVMVAGLLALIYGGFSYTSENTAAKVGPIELRVEQDKRVNIPAWAGVAAIAAGALVLLTSKRR